MTWLKRGKEATIEEVFCRNIGVKSLEDVNMWFRKSYAGEYHINDIDKAVKLTLKFKDRPITIVGDYDADGVTSTAILYLSLKWAGFKYLNYRIPKRFSEGYGIIDEGFN